jgi:hypothetical protein
LIVPLALVAWLFWAVDHYDLLSALNKASINWGPRLLLTAWISIGAALGIIFHIVFWILARLLPRDPGLNPSHEIAFHFIGVVGVIYAVLVAFVVVTGWQSRDYAENLVIKEQHNIDDLFHLESAYPSHEARLVRFMLRDYATDTLAEWTQMRHGKDLCVDIADSSISCLGAEGAISKRANMLAHCIIDLTVRLPMTRHEQAMRQEPVIYQEIVRLTQSFSENREERRARYRARMVQPMLWWSFLLGALILLSMTYAVPGQYWVSQLIRTTALFAMIGMMVALAVAFDRPFEGHTQISGSTWGELVVHFDRDLGNEEAPYDYLPGECTVI